MLGSTYEAWTADSVMAKLASLSAMAEANMGVPLGLFIRAMNYPVQGEFVSRRGHVNAENLQSFLLGHEARITRGESESGPGSIIITWTEIEGAQDVLVISPEETEFMAMFDGEYAHFRNDVINCYDERVIGFLELEENSVPPDASYEPRYYRNLVGVWERTLPELDHGPRLSVIRHASLGELRRNYDWRDVIRRDCWPSKQAPLAHSTIWMCPSRVGFASLRERDRKAGMTSGTIRCEHGVIKVMNGVLLRTEGPFEQSLLHLIGQPVTQKSRNAKPLELSATRGGMRDVRMLAADSLSRGMMLVRYMTLLGYHVSLHDCTRNPHVNVNRMSRMHVKLIIRGNIMEAGMGEVEITADIRELEDAEWEMTSPESSYVIDAGPENEMACSALLSNFDAWIADMKQIVDPVLATRNYDSVDQGINSYEFFKESIRERFSWTDSTGREIECIKEALESIAWEKGYENRPTKLSTLSFMPYEGMTIDGWRRLRHALMTAARRPGRLYATAINFEFLVREAKRFSQGTLSKLRLEYLEDRNCLLMYGCVIGHAPVLDGVRRSMMGVHDETGMATPVSLGKLKWDPPRKVGSIGYMSDQWNIAYDELFVKWTRQFAGEMRELMAKGYPITEDQDGDFTLEHPSGKRMMLGYISCWESESDMTQAVTYRMPIRQRVDRALAWLECHAGKDNHDSTNESA